MARQGRQEFTGSGAGGSVKEKKENKEKRSSKDGKNAENSPKSERSSKSERSPRSSSSKKSKRGDGSAEPLLDGPIEVSYGAAERSSRSSTASTTMLLEHADSQGLHQSQAKLKVVTGLSSVA